jgi:UDP-2,3-diacylglucosamine pyrophosphatase LpxH
MPLRASKLSQEDYDRAIAKGLDRAFAAAEEESCELSDLRAVAISDLHRGARDGADDFQRAEPAYCAALGSYLEREYELWLLGDVEELWENDIDEVLSEYTDVLELERQFAAGPGLRRFWGNHDLDWSKAKVVSEKLGPYLAGIEVKEALRLTVLDRGRPLGTLFLAHGHQGTDFSDRFSFISRFVLRNVWRRIQASQGWLSTTPAQSYRLRHKHDKAMFRWARTRANDAGGRPVLIAGHTHHPVFPGSPSPHPEPGGIAELERALAEARRAGDADKAAGLRAQLEQRRALGRAEKYEEPEIDPPCYFNTGCCCFPDGDVTCLELTGGTIRLLRWPDDEGRARPKELAPPLSLREVLGAAS